MIAMVNMDFSRRIVIRTDDLPWQPSPRPGVWRKPLAREEAERGHATSVVRYDLGASFPRHGHPLGEEILVLEGTFSDEHGDFGAGTYFRNGPGSSHAPFSKEGCTLFVKLHQFLPEDRTQVCVDTSTAAWLPEEEGIEALPLHRFADERVMLMRLSAGARARSAKQPGGEEIFVLSGELTDEHGAYPRGTWLRGPRESEHALYAQRETLAWIKTGHLGGT